jgi:hypothetical protein
VPTNDPNGGGLCLFACQNDDACDRDYACFPGLNVCYYTFCGPDQGNNNGRLYAGCQAGSAQQWAGTCLPLPVGDPQAPTPFGICLEAGNAAEGQPCDNQIAGRDAAARNLTCAPGALCFGDPDDPLDPNRDWDGRGACAGLCDPRAPACGAGRRCIDLSNEDDPNTAQSDETRYLGLCLQADCSISRDDCGAGRHCRPYTLVADDGLCGAAGNAGIGQACERHADCAGQAFCANTGNGPICLQICNPAQANACPEGLECFAQDGWAYGVCL